MTLPITVLLKISIWHQMDISTNVDINTYTLSLAQAYTHAHIHKHLVTVNRCQGHCGGSQVFSSVPYQKQYNIFHTLLTQNAEVRIYKLAHARAHTHTYTHKTSKRQLRM